MRLFLGEQGDLRSQDVQLLQQVLVLLHEIVRYLEHLHFVELGLQSRGLLGWLFRLL